MRAQTRNPFLVNFLDGHCEEIQQQRNELKRPYGDVNLVSRNRAGFRGFEIGDKQRHPILAPWGLSEGDEKLFRVIETHLGDNL